MLGNEKEETAEREGRIASVVCTKLGLRLMLVTRMSFASAVASSFMRYQGW